LNTLCSYGGPLPEKSEALVYRISLAGHQLFAKSLCGNMFKGGFALVKAQACNEAVCNAEDRQYDLI
jgi:hypothetical protein